MVGLFETTDDDYRRWQTTGWHGLTALLELGRQHRLPPLLWTLPAHMSVSGQTTMHTDAAREQFEAWHAALDAAPEFERTHLGTSPGGAHRNETERDGRHRLAAAFETCTPLNRCTVVITAQWWDDDAAADSASDGGGVASGPAGGGR